MTRKLFAVALFVLGSGICLSGATADAAEEAPAPRAVGEGDKPGAKGKFGGFDKGKFGGFGGGKFDPEKFKEMKGKFGKEGGFGKGGFPFPGGEGKGGFGKGKGGFPGGKGGPGGERGKGGPGKKKGDEE
jgi:hypothetical protein